MKDYNLTLRNLRAKNICWSYPCDLDSFKDLVVCLFIMNRVVVKGFPQGLRAPSKISGVQL